MKEFYLVRKKRKRFIKAISSSFARIIIAIIAILIAYFLGLIVETIPFPNCNQYSFEFENFMKSIYSFGCGILRFLSIIFYIIGINEAIAGITRYNFLKLIYSIIFE